MEIRVGITMQEEDIMFRPDPKQIGKRADENVAL